MNYKCPKCSKEIIADNKNDLTDNNIVIKSKLVFLNDDGNVMCRCPQCKKVVGLPLNFMKSSNSIQEKQIIDL